jgi:hypothetical protein
MLTICHNFVLGYCFNMTCLFVGSVPLNSVNAALNSFCTDCTVISEVSYATWSSARSCVTSSACVFGVVSVSCSTSPFSCSSDFLSYHINCYVW